MIPRVRSLKDEHFKQFAKSRSRTHHGDLFSVRLYALLGQPAKGAIVVAAKVVKGASKRNLLKRRARAILYPRIKNADGFSLVVYAKHGAATASYQEIADDLNRIVSAMINGSGQRAHTK